MPGRNGTGPMGRGATTGRGFGFCNGVNVVGYGAGSKTGQGRGHGMGLGRNSVADSAVSKTQKELLQDQREFLKSRLDTISKQLDSL